MRLRATQGEESPVLATADQIQIRTPKYDAVARQIRGACRRHTAKQERRGRAVVEEFWVTHEQPNLSALVNITAVRSVAGASDSVLREDNIAGLLTQANVPHQEGRDGRQTCRGPVSSLWQEPTPARPPIAGERDRLEYLRSIHCEKVPAMRTVIPERIFTR